jgi:hypothetical protein
MLSFLLVVAAVVLRRLVVRPNAGILLGSFSPSSFSELSHDDDDDYNENNQIVVQTHDRKKEHGRL